MYWKINVLNSWKMSSQTWKKAISLHNPNSISLRINSLFYSWILIKHDMCIHLSFPYYYVNTFYFYINIEEEQVNNNRHILLNFKRSWCIYPDCHYTMIFPLQISMTSNINRCLLQRYSVDTFVLLKYLRHYIFML